jgi:hypothetical protein
MVSKCRVRTYYKSGMQCLSMKIRLGGANLNRKLARCNQGAIGWMQHDSSASQSNILKEIIKETRIDLHSFSWPTVR